LETLSRGAIETSEGELSWQAAADQVAPFYRQVLETGRGGRAPVLHSPRAQPLEAGAD
jgi:hypothetical protein